MRKPNPGVNGQPQEASAPSREFPADWTPKSLPQAQALASEAQILLFGGAAGSLKSETLLVDAAREHAHPGLRGILFRRSYPELEKTLIRRSRELFPALGARYHENKRIWTFPSGATIEFAYCEAEKDIFRYQGAEYSFIGFDESTHFAEFPIRYMLSRLRSTHPGLKLRLRLASNPGNIGHGLHKAIFHGPTCTHCRLTARSRQPGQIYADAVWPSDQAPIRKTTCFIPGTVHDHRLLNADYAQSLATLPGAYRKALLEGCWDVYEGQFFDHWDPARMVVAREEIGERPWWPHWVGADYGFNGSQAAAYLLCKSPAGPNYPHGRVYVLEEYTAKHQKAADFALALARRMGRSTAADDAQQRRIAAWYLSPDAWAERGDDFSLAEQMRRASGIEFQPASTDRLGGAMLVYSQLDSGELVISSRCGQLIEAIPSRIHDTARPDDILKVAGDPLDDCMDALRYGLYSHVSPAQGPSGFAFDYQHAHSDPTIAMLQRRVAEQRFVEHQRPKRYLPFRSPRHG